MPRHRQWPVTPALRLCNDGECQQNRGTATQFTLCRNPSTVRFDEMFHNGKAETGAAFLTRAARIDAIKPLENARQVLGGNARAGIADPHDDVAVRLSGEHTHAAPP